MRYCKSSVRGIKLNGDIMLEELYALAEHAAKR